VVPRFFSPLAPKIYISAKKKFLALKGNKGPGAEHRLADRETVGRRLGNGGG
jgi:hypothetical protein